MINRKFALAAAFIFAGTAAFSAVSQETVDRITEYLSTQTYDRAEVRVGPNQIKVEMISGDQKVEVILRTEDLVELKRETEAVGLFDNNSPGVVIRERKRDFLRVDDDSNDDDEDGDDSDDDSSDDDSDDNSGGSDDSDDDSNDDNGGDRDGSDDSNDDDSNDDNGNDDDDDNSGNDDNSGDDGDDD